MQQSSSTISIKNESLMYNSGKKEKKPFFPEAILKLQQKNKNSYLDKLSIQKNIQAIEDSNFQGQKRKKSVVDILEQEERNELKEKINEQLDIKKSKLLDDQKPQQIVNPLDQSQVFTNTKQQYEMKLKEKDFESQELQRIDKKKRQMEIEGKITKLINNKKIFNKSKESENLKDVQQFQKDAYLVDMQSHIKNLNAIHQKHDFQKLNRLKALQKQFLAEKQAYIEKQQFKLDLDFIDFKQNNIENSESNRENYTDNQNYENPYLLDDSPTKEKERQRQLYKQKLQIKQDIELINFSKQKRRDAKQYFDSFKPQKKLQSLNDLLQKLEKDENCNFGENKVSFNQAVNKNDDFIFYQQLHQKIDKEQKTFTNQKAYQEAQKKLQLENTDTVVSPQDLEKLNNSAENIFEDYGDMIQQNIDDLQHQINQIQNQISAKYLINFDKPMENQIQRLETQIQSDGSENSSDYDDEELEQRKKNEYEDFKKKAEHLRTIVKKLNKQTFNDKWAIQEQRVQEKINRENRRIQKLFEKQQKISSLVLDNNNSYNKKHNIQSKVFTNNKNSQNNSQQRKNSQNMTLKTMETYYQGNIEPIQEDSRENNFQLGYNSTKNSTVQKFQSPRTKNLQNLFNLTQQSNNTESNTNLQYSSKYQINTQEQESSVEINSQKSIDLPQINKMLKSIKNQEQLRINTEQDLQTKGYKHKRNEKRFQTQQYLSPQNQKSTYLNNLYSPTQQDILYYNTSIVSPQSKTTPKSDDKFINSMLAYKSDKYFQSQNKLNKISQSTNNLDKQNNSNQYYLQKPKKPQRNPVMFPSKSTNNIDSDAGVSEQDTMSQIPDITSKKNSVFSITNNNNLQRFSIPNIRQSFQGGVRKSMQINTKQKLRNNVMQFQKQVDHERKTLLLEKVQFKKNMENIEKGQNSLIRKYEISNNNQEDFHYLMDYDQENEHTKLKRKIVGSQGIQQNIKKTYKKF